MLGLYGETGEVHGKRAVPAEGFLRYHSRDECKVSKVEDLIKSTVSL